MLSRRSALVPQTLSALTLGIAAAGLVCTAVATPSASSPQVRLVRAQPAIVKSACRMAQRRVRVHVSCPSLIPATRYIRRTGLWGSLSSPPHLWWITFNNGDNGPGYLHWMAGGGTMKAIQLDVLGDSMNEVKGLPRLVARRTVMGYRVVLYEFPPYPAGGPNGGHMLSLVRCSDLGVFASIHQSIDGDYQAQVAAMASDLARRSGCPTSSH